MKPKSFLIFSLCVIFASCRQSITNLLDPTDCVDVKNVYETVDMTVFNGFVDNIAVSDLYRIYGEPDSIYDAEESTTIEGYDIYEYNVEDGSIDCYVPRNNNKSSFAVEYIYFEPQSNINVSDFIKDEKLCKQISSSKNNVYYISDRNRNFVRIRLDETDKSKILNIALNDITLLGIYSNDIESIVKEVKDELPCDFTDLGTLTSLDYKNNCLTFKIDVNEMPNMSLKNIVDSTPKLAEAITMHNMYNQGGYIAYADNSLLKKKASICYILKGNTSGESVKLELPFEKLQNLIGSNITNEKALMSKVILDNCLGPVDLNSWLRSEKIYVENNCLTIPFTVKLCDDDIANLEENFKNYVAGIFANLDNPDSRYVFFAYKCDYNLKVIFNVYESEKKLETTFDTDDLWILMENMQ